jgi:hypothetical protein
MVPYCTSDGGGESEDFLIRKARRSCDRQFHCDAILTGSCFVDWSSVREMRREFFAREKRKPPGIERLSRLSNLINVAGAG